MKIRFILLLAVLLFAVSACDDGGAESPAAKEDLVETEQQEDMEKGNEVEQVNATDEVEEGQIVTEEDNRSPDIAVRGDMTLMEDEIEVDIESNLPAGVDVSIRAYGYPYGGYVTSTILTNEKVVVGENGEINDSISFDETFYEQHKNEPIRLELRFDPSSISSLHENSDELQSIYGETGEKLEGPFVVEIQHSYQDNPSYMISVSVVGPANAGEVFTMEEPVVGEPPADYGEPEVWMEAEIVDIDHRYVHIEGSSNLMEGMLLFGNIKSNEETFHNQNAFSYNTEVRKDGTFYMPVEYKSLTDEGFIRIYAEAGFNHPRGRAVLDVYGEEFDNLEGDIVKQRYRDQTEQMIEFIIPLNPEYEDAPEDVDVTKDGKEIKLILSDEILFEFGESDVTAEGEQVIEEIADWLGNEEYNGLVKIHGHTDNVSGDEINQPLSEDRAENVHALILSNLENDSVFEFEVEGFGQYEPLATNETDEGRQRNRRVEILLQAEAAEE